MENSQEANKRRKNRWRWQENKSMYNAKKTEQFYEDNFFEDSVEGFTSFQTPDNQGEKLTELNDDNSHAPATDQKKEGPIKVSTTPATKETLQSKPTSKPGQSSAMIDMFDMRPIIKPVVKPKGQITLNLSGQTANKPQTVPTKKVPKFPTVRPNLTVIDPNNVGKAQNTQSNSTTAITKNIEESPSQAKSVELNSVTTDTDTKPVKNIGEQTTGQNSALTTGQNSTQTTGKNNAQTTGKNNAQTSGQNIPQISGKNIPQISGKNIPQITGQTRSTGFKGRMPAASFLTYAMPLASPKGIPRSFLMNRPDAVPNVPTSQDGSKALTETPVSRQDFVLPKNSGRSNYNRYEKTSQSPSLMDSKTGPTEREIFEQLYINVDNNEGRSEQYSPSDTYADNSTAEGFDDEHSRSPETGSKRLSAFQRLGPKANAKKPKLTINLLVNKDQSVREVVDSSSEDDKYTLPPLRHDIQTSTDETVMKYLVIWPSKKNMTSHRKSVTYRQSKSVMMLELEHMEEAYIKDNTFFIVMVTGYPPSWTKENVLDAVLESVKGKSLIPIFIEFQKNECKFLVLRSKPALVAIHKYGFIIHKDDVELRISISHSILTTNQIDFIPRLVLRKRLIMAIEKEFELNLSEFTTKSDISHFIYFPLNRVENQSELVQLQSAVPWLHLTKLVLSRNRITTLSGFDLENTTPNLKHLDVSHNYINDMSEIIKCRLLPLNTIVLEGNPVCLDYMQEMYVKVLRMLFPGLKEIDGIKLSIPGEFPKYQRNYCPEDARMVVEKVLEVMFPLLDANAEDRLLIENLYDANALMTITFMHKLRYGPIYKEHRGLFNRARWLEEGDSDSIQGAPAIAKLMYRWPPLRHDPSTFTVDVLCHTYATSIIKISGIMKVTAESLAENEHLLSFTRTLVVNTNDGDEYKITNELLYWGLPEKEMTKNAFRLTTGRNFSLNLKLESPPDEDLKENLVEIFMRLTELERKPSIKCLEMKEWHLKNAIEYFYKLLKLDNIEPLLN